MEFLLNVVLILLALGGFALSFFIHKKKQANKVLVCPIGADCNAVVHSDYSRFFGVPLEYIGMFYYAAVAASYMVFLLIPSTTLPPFALAVLSMTSIALLFSAYLTFIQAFNLKQWCTWCLMSAGLSAFIFTASLMASKFGFVALLEENYEIFLIIHTLGIAIGAGGAIIGGVLFVKFLKDCRISKIEADITRTISQIVWFALAILALSGAALYFPGIGEWGKAPAFALKMAIVDIIIINRLFLDLLIFPRLTRASLEVESAETNFKIQTSAGWKLSFALGAVSIVSWIFVLILSVPLEAVFGVNLYFLVGIYALALFISAFIGWLFSVFSGRAISLS